MNGELKTIFGDSITVESTSIPIAHIKYKGSSKTYVTWVLLNETPALCADDEPLYSVCQVDIDIYSDGNYSKIINAIKNLMKNNEWLWVEDSQEMYEEDTELYHKTITFEKERNL